MFKNRTINIKNIFFLLFYIILLIPFFEIPYFTEYLNKFNTLYDLLLMFSFMIILLWTFKKKYLSKINIYIIIMLVILFFSSLINGTDILFCLKDIIKIFGLSLLTEYGIKYDKNNFIKSASFFLSILVYINLISIIKYPIGLYMNKTGYIENWFLGYKNTHILYILPGILFNFLNGYNKKNQLTIYNYIFFIISFISTLLVNNGTGIIGLFIILLFLLFSKYISKVNIINIKNIIIAYIFLFFGIIIFRLQNIFKFLIVDILHKDLTFTGRTYIWDKAIKMISSKPLLGYGNVSFEYNKIIYSTHNMVLGVLHKTGIIGLFLFLCMMFVTIKELYFTRKENVSKLLCVFLIVYLIMMLTESYSFKLFFFILVICYNIKLLINGGNDENDTSCK